VNPGQRREVLKRPSVNPPDGVHAEVHRQHLGCVWQREQRVGGEERERLLQLMHLL
jgi:hypothetical protein